MDVDLIFKIAAVGILVAVLNLVLDPIFIFGLLGVPRLGVAVGRNRL